MCLKTEKSHHYFNSASLLFLNMHSYYPTNRIAHTMAFLTQSLHLEGSIQRPIILPLSCILLLQYQYESMKALSSHYNTALNGILLPFGLPLLIFKTIWIWSHTIHFIF